MDDLQKLILQDIGCYCNLSNLNEWNYEDRVIKPLKHNGHFDFSYSAGVTKVVLLLPGQSYVIKIPFSCLDDENPDDAYCSDFCNAPLDAEWDYCLAETRIYSAAEEAGVEICFGSCVSALPTPSVCLLMFPMPLTPISLRFPTVGTTAS